jgi:predicted DNA binding CopG/RHH family protein
MKKYKLTREEQAIEANIEKLKPVSPEKKEKIENIIDKAKKSRAISLRISQYDLEKLKEKAKEEGIPYQTLINMVLHKYVQRRLTDKEEFIKMFRAMKESEAI